MCFSSSFKCFVVARAMASRLCFAFSVFLKLQKKEVRVGPAQRSVAETWGPLCFQQGIRCRDPYCLLTHLFFPSKYIYGNFALLTFHHVFFFLTSQLNVTCYFEKMKVSRLLITVLFTYPQEPFADLYNTFQKGLLQTELVILEPIRPHKSKCFYSLRI